MTTDTSASADNENVKLQDIESAKKDDAGSPLTTNHGVKINDNQNSLKAGERGATLIEDFILREKFIILIMSEYQSE